VVFFRDYKVFNQTYDQDGIYMHEKAENKMKQVSENQLKAAVAGCAEIIKCLKQNDSTSHIDLRQQMTEWYLAT
jgi:hypothetical protein